VITLYYHCRQDAFYNYNYPQQQSEELEEKQDDGGLIDRFFFNTRIPLPLAILLFAVDIIVSINRNRHM